MNLFRRISEAWSHRPDAIALEFATSRWTWREIEKKSATYAQALSHLGVRRGDRVATQVEKSPEAIFTYLACLRMGAIYLPLNTAYTDPEIAYFLEDAEPSVFVVDPSRSEGAQALAKMAKTRCEVVTLDAEGQGSLTDLAATEGGDGKNPETVESDPEDLAAILYTSGTTGRSKGAMITHSNLVSNAEALAKAWGFGPPDVLLHALPIFHIHGLFISLHTAWISGARVRGLPKFAAGSVIRSLPGSTVFMGVPTYYTRLLEDPGFTREACAGLRLFVSGSAPLLIETFEQFAVRTGHRILERYGMTETGINTSNPLEGERVPGTVGTRLPGVEVRLVRGVIEVRGPNVFAGYWRQPEKTRAEFTQDGFFVTGDLGTKDRRGYLTIVGRAKDLVITGGYNVYPKEIELCLDRFEDIEESAVFGLPHPDFGEAVAAAVVLRTKSASTYPEDVQSSEARWIGKLKRELAAYKVPKRIFVVKELPRNTMGKVQKTVLRSLFKF